MVWNKADLHTEVLGEFVERSVFQLSYDEQQSCRVLKYGEAHAAEQREHYAKRVFEGRCTKCPNTTRPGRRTCAECNDKMTARQRARRQVMRERLPELRGGTTHHFTILARCNKLKCVAGKIEGKDGPYKCPRCAGDGVREVDGYITCNTYEDGRLGELFIRVGKSGAEEAIYEQWAIGASVAIQFGVPVEAYFRKFLATQFEPAGATKNKSIARCTSVLDYVARYVLMKFCPAESTEKTEVQP